MRLLTPILLAAAIFASQPAPAAAGRPALDPTIATAAPQDRVVAWIYFTDRAGADRDPAALASARAHLTAKALDRRLRRGTLQQTTAADLPVHAAYVRALTARGAKLRGTSRWLNAASIETTAELAREVARLPFVARVERVATGARIRPVEVQSSIEEPALRTTGALAGGAAPGDTAYYGATLKQLAMMQVPQMHAQGLTGAGVLVCMLDTGFRTTHQIFAGLNLVATRDFIHGDTNVDDEAGQDPNGAASHGTATLACTGGHLPGTYASAGIGASFALGKTEDVSSETPAEMDYWLFGAEWADSLGADVISSSLGYSQFDSPHPSYTYADMDGRTTVVTLAAVEAMRRGITVVTAAGNEGAVPWHYLIAPADADSIVAVGAVDSFNVVTSFSSRGPSSDGRIKPDVMAMGRSVYLIPLSSNTGFTRASGTSFATPLTAGVAALLLEAHPAWTPVQVRDALRETALGHEAPNNDYGYGIVQGFEALTWSPPVADVPGRGPVDRLALSAGPNPLRGGESAIVRFAAPLGRDISLEVVDVAGRSRARLFAGASRGEQAVAWAARDAAGDRLAPGVYWLRLAARDAAYGTQATRIVLLP